MSISRCRWGDDSHSPAASVNELKNMTAVILAGGLGTRLRSVVGDRPKVLAPVQGRPFFSVFIGPIGRLRLSLGHIVHGILGK